MKLHFLRTNRRLHGILSIIVLGLVMSPAGSMGQPQSTEAQESPKTRPADLIPAGGRELVRPLPPEERAGVIRQFLIERQTHQMAPPDEWRPPKAQTASMSNGSIAYVNPDDELWLIDPDGNNPRSLTQALPLTVTSQAAWSPDKSRLAFAARDEGGTVHLHIIPSEGTGTDLQTFPQSFAEIDNPAWSPDGRHIAFNAREADDIWGTYTINVDSGNLARLAHDDAHSERHGSGVTWSPDSQWIAFGMKKNNGRWSVFKARPDGSGLKELAAMGGDYSCENGCINCSNDPDLVLSPTWSPDSTQIAFIAGRARRVEDELDPKCVALFDVFAADPEGIEPPWRLVQEIVNSENSFGGATAGPLFWSPDNATLGMGGRAGDGKLHLYTIDVPSRGVRQLNCKRGGGLWFDWSPDGTHIAAGFTEGEAQDLHTVDPTADQCSEKLADGRWPAWSTSTAGVPHVELSITAIEVTQGIQCLNNPDCFGDPAESETVRQLYDEYCGEDNPNCDNAVPLVTARPTWVRVYPDCGVDCDNLPGVRAVLLGRKSDQSNFTEIDTADPITIVHPRDLRAARYRFNYSHTFNFWLPPEWRSGPIEFRAELSINGATADYTLPPLIFTPVRPPIIASVPIDHAGLLPTEMEIQQDALLRLFPVAAAGNLAARFLPWTSMTWSYACPTGRIGQWLLARELKKHVGFGSANRTQVDKIFAFFPDDRCPGDGNSEGIPGQAAWGDELARSSSMAHEIGHLYGRRHTMKSGEDTRDWRTDWPYDSDFIQEIGVAVVGSVDPLETPLNPVLNPYIRGDLMSYKPERWVSPFTYAQLFRALRGVPVVHTSSSAILQVPGAPQVVVSGIALTDTVQFDPVYQVNWQTAIENPPVGTEYCLELRDGGGSLLDEYCFDIEMTDEIGQTSVIEGFVIARHYPTGLSRVALRRGSILLGEITASPNEPTVTVVSPNGGESWTASGSYAITWSASDADGDPLTYSVFYSPDGGQSLIPVAVDVTETSYELDTTQIAGSTNARIRVLATDGMNTASDDSDAPFTVATKPPQAFILAPEDSAIAPPGRLVVFFGQGYDLEDGPLGAESLSWSSDRDGVLGAGGELALSNLSPGLHEITLTATDSDGNQATASISLFVGHRLYLPLVVNKPPARMASTR